MSPCEKAHLKKMVDASGMKNTSAYLRKMALNGYIIQFEVSDLSECSRLLASAANNLNQIARRVNSGGTAYSDEIAALQSNLDENRVLFGKILERLAKLKL